MRDLQSLREASVVVSWTRASPRVKGPKLGTRDFGTTGYKAEHKSAKALVGQFPGPPEAKVSRKAIGVSRH
jgi:hypothetical protein